MKKIILSGAVLASLIAAQGTIYTTNWNSGFANNGIVPDHNFSGWTDNRKVTAMPAGTLQDVRVTLDIAGGWNGDLYAYLVHEGGFTVLLNQVGPGAFGYGDTGFAVTLSDSGTADLQNYQAHSPGYNGNGQLTGIWQADGVGFAAGNFLSTSPNGTWSLFIADLSGGGVSTVQSWGLQMDIVAVPEVETWVAAALAGAFGAFWVNRQIWGLNRRDASR